MLQKRNIKQKYRLFQNVLVYFIGASKSSRRLDEKEQKSHVYADAEAEKVEKTKYINSNKCLINYMETNETLWKERAIVILWYECEAKL